MTDHLEPDRDQLEIYFESLFRHRGTVGYVSMRSFLHDNRVLKPIRSVPLDKADWKFLIDVAADQARRAANSPQPAVFAPPVAVFNNPNGWQAREEDLYLGLVITAELDEHPEEARQKLQEILGEGTLVVKSGGQWINGGGEPEDKLHLHWRLAVPAQGDNLKKLKKARALVAAIVGADPSNIPAVHCLRAAGSWHRKGAPRLCTIFDQHPDVEIDLDEALKALEAEAPPFDGGGGGDYPGEFVELQELIRRIKAGESLHPSVRIIAGKYARKKHPIETCFDLVRAAFTMANQERYGGRWEGCVKLIRWVYAEEAKKDETLESVRIDTVQMTSIRWLWPGRFAFGKLGLITGLPDEGKGQLLWYIIANVTTGGLWPCGEGTAPIGNVIVLEAEDDLHDTVKPRLVAAGADLSRVHFLNMVKVNGKGDKRMFSLVTDLPKLKKKVQEIGDVALIVVDPMSAYLGRTKQVDTFRSTDVRNVLAPFVDLASELNIAIIAIMHFNKKVDVTNVLLRVSDSAAFTAAARHLYGVIDDRPNKRKLFVRGKNNVASSEQKTLAYQFGLRMVGHDAKGEEIWAPHILWEPNPVDITPSEAMSSGNGRPPEARANAKDFLKKKLAGGAVKMDDLIDEANAEGVTRPTLYRAKLELRIGSRKDDDGEWVWFLSENPTPKYTDD